MSRDTEPSAASGTTRPVVAARVPEPPERPSAPPRPTSPPPPAVPPRPAKPPRATVPRPAEEPPGPPRAADRLPDGPAAAPARAVRRPPRPTMPPQPPPPTGEPLTGPRRAGAEPVRQAPGTSAASAAPAARRSGDGPPGSHPADSSTFQLRPTAAHAARPSRRTVAAVACLVLGTGLLGGVGTGIWFTDDAGAETGAAAEYDASRQLWHTVPVDTLFPRTVRGEGAGPGGADRTWTRVAVAPDSDCANAFDASLAHALAPVGCQRLVRATYADETSSSVTTVGIVFTEADEEGMGTLRERFAEEKLGDRPDLMPRAYPARGTVAADFADPQRASWTLSVLTDAPAVVYTVSGFADGRTVTDPQPAAEATAKGRTTAAAQAGLGHDAQSIAEHVERGLRAELPGREEPEDPS
ncbi:hypothetical protein [Streptomyces sp. Z26]|uniref:hypothetical protein n=1 Tax=Streptomyces sp. Z26 TaxID=2500177 RepID=UPI001F0C79FF|nr:hypothetical protein [Streptomyces sp. Z26]